MITREEFIKKWVTALRSGKYRQTTNVLHRTRGGHSYCCLGVACEIAIEEGLIKTSKKDGNYEISYGRNEERVLMPVHLAKFLGMDTAGEFKRVVEYRDRTYHALTGLNDLRVPFKQIADIIEENIAARNFKRK